MMSVEVRSVNGRPNASTPVTASGTACIIRVLRRFRNSSFWCATVSDIISVVSSARLPLCSSMDTVAAPRVWAELLDRLRLLGRRTLRVILRSTFRCRRTVRSSQELPCFLCDPDWSYQQIDWTLKKRRMVPLDFVSQKEENPSANEETRSPNPFGQNQQNHPQKNHGDADTMEQFVPAGRVLVIVLRHIVRQARHSAPPCGGGPLRGNETLYPKRSLG